MTQFYCLIVLPDVGTLPAKPRSKSSNRWETRAEIVRRYLKLRANRGIIANGYLLSDPAWDMLLDLFVAHIAGRQISVSSACIASRRPQTTSLRYIDRMVQQGLLRRDKDPHDQRRVHLHITEKAKFAIADWVDALQEQLAKV